jgi:hypothetical protein
MRGKAWQPAEDAAREALGIREKLQPDDWTTFNTRAMLGGAIAGRGAAFLASDKLAAEKLFAEAEPLITEGYQGMQERRDKIPPEGQVRLQEAAQRLADMYTAWEKPEAAAMWKQELLKLK